MKLEASLTLALALALPCGRSQAADCAHSAPREAHLEASGAESLRVLARAGFLRIEGRQGTTAVDVSGTACASRESMLKRIRLRAERRGAELYVEADVPESDWFWSGEARLDLALRVPQGLRVEVEDGSGPVEIRGISSLRLDDGSGEAAIEDVAGDVRIVDGSGSLRVVKVGGALRVRDGSGEIEVRDVTGPVTIEEDGSGSIDVQDTREGVTVRSDGSGDISVRRVAGDFVVEDDGSGGVHYENVGGSVRLPRDE
jgi:DUF4097 and DUF4098 domain-containing protein YvlB